MTVWSIRRCLWCTEQRWKVSKFRCNLNIMNEWVQKKKNLNTALNIVLVGWWPAAQTGVVILTLGCYWLGAGALSSHQGRVLGLGCDPLPHSLQVCLWWVAAQSYRVYNWGYKYVGGCGWLQDGESGGLLYHTISLGFTRGCSSGQLPQVFCALPQNLYTACHTAGQDRFKNIFLRSFRCYSTFSWTILGSYLLTEYCEYR